ncbi:uncharacterized protein LOC142024919 [Carettochelys insculpta]|uniref:uncharacterized protein LOC142024919 n=1 Tax=Carettochelys insculpta TaxID=44489 RepID=UPI003EBEFA02
MPAPRGRRAPAWSTPEVVDLLGLWGQEGVQAQLRNSRRNFDIYSQIARGMEEKGYDRDPQQCRVKIKELRQAYQKAKEANSRSGAEPQTCRFYKELHAILGSDSASPAKHPVDTLGGLDAQSNGMNSEIEVLIKEEDEEEEEYGGQAAAASASIGAGVASHDLFLTPEHSSHSQQSSPGEPDAGEGTSAAAHVAFGASPPPPEERLGQIRRQKKRTREDMFQEVLRASRASEREQRAWRVLIDDKMQRDSEDRRNAQQEMIALLREQTDMLRSLIELQADHIRARFPLQPIENCIPGGPYVDAPAFHVSAGAAPPPQALHPTEDYAQ